MNDHEAPPRLYGEQEIGRILKRATELQHREPTAPAAGGMTLSELEEIAAEAGIDPRYLRRAASEIEGGIGDPSVWRRVVGDDLVVMREIELEGEVSDEGFERIVAAIQTKSREHGQPSLLGRTLTWRAETANKTRTVQIVVTSRDGRTRIRLEENLVQTAVGLFAGFGTGRGAGVGVGVGVPIGMNVLGSVLFAWAAPLGVTALTYIGCREVYRRMVAKRRRVAGELFDLVVTEAQASIDAATPPLASPATPRAPRLGDGV